jgi:hypothetical protein
MNNLNESMDAICNLERRMKEAGFENANDAFALFVLTDTLEIVREKLKRALDAQSYITRIVAFRQKQVADVSSALSKLQQAGEGIK